MSFGVGVGRRFVVVVVVVLPLEQLLGMTGRDPCMFLSPSQQWISSTKSVADVYCWEVGVIIALSWCQHRIGPPRKLVLLTDGWDWFECGAPRCLTRDAPRLERMMRHHGCCSRSDGHFLTIFLNF